MKPLLSPPVEVLANPWHCPSQLARSRKITRRIARSHYENFLVASILLPRAMRQPFYDVYAFCRSADDLADESESAEAATAGLAKYRQSIAELFDERLECRLEGQLEVRLEDRLEGHETSGLFVALSDTVRRFDLPREPFDHLLDAFVQDQTVQRYADESALFRYCSRSANPVGRLVLAMADCDSEENLRHSDEICTALQLVNFWQDVKRDYTIGRIYLPASVMQHHGFAESLVASTIAASHITPPSIRAAIASQCEQTRERFERGRVLVENVPAWLAADIELFIGGGLATLDAIARIDYDVLRIRPRVSKLKQAGLVFRTTLNRWLGPRGDTNTADTNREPRKIANGGTS